MHGSFSAQCPDRLIRFIARFVNRNRAKGVKLVAEQGAEGGRDSREEMDMLNALVVVEFPAELGNLASHSHSVRGAFHPHLRGSTRQLAADMMAGDNPPRGE